MRSYRSSLICAPLIWFEGEFRENVLVRVDESGKIAQIGTDLSPNDGETTVVLENQVLFEILGA